MILLITLLITALLALTSHALGAAFFWCLMVALLHAFEEGRGQLWIYFGKLAEAHWLERTEHGFALIVAPALLLQAAAAYLAFMGDSLDPFWLAVLIGARIGDAVFSHAVPAARNREATNPGLPTAALYAVDGLILALIWHAQMMAVGHAALLGFACGAGFFASVLPGLRISRIVLD